MTAPPVPERTVPLRTCVGCRSRTVKAELVRVVADGNVCIPDERYRHAGRGAYLHRDLACLDRAERRRALPRALRVSGSLDTAPVRHYLSQLPHSTQERFG